MARIAEEVEGFKLTNLSIDELLNKTFRNQINALGLDAISLVLISNKKSGTKALPVFPVMMNHQNSEEIKSKVLHIQSPDPRLLAQLLKSLKEVRHEGRNRA